MFRIEKIEAGYRDKNIINNISFSVKTNEFTAILGLNGTGKTTLLKTIGGLLKPVSGKVLVNGQDMLLLNEKELAKHISYMPQRHSIIYDTKVIDVVLMGITPYLKLFESPNKKHKEMAHKILESMGIVRYVDSNFFNLSEGQKQLIIIARSLMQDAEVMLFDEPDSALDFKNKHMIMNIIKDILEKKDKIGIVTLHDPNFALRYCDKIIIINEGKIYSEFSIKDIGIKYLIDTFSKIYGEIDIVSHKDKYVIVR